MTKAAWTYQFEAFAGKLLTTHKCPGFSVGLAKNGETIYAQGFGYRNAAEGLPATATTVHGIGSVTKSFTCVAIMQLAERGKLKVDDPVVKYLPEFRTPDPERTKQITIHHLMTHSSGIPPLRTLYPAMLASMRNDPGAKEIVAKLTDFSEVNTYTELMDFIAKQEFELLGEVGAQFSYSNDGYALLGAIIERVSGLSYIEFMQENVLKPAGMADSFIELESLYKHPELTIPYVINKEHDEAVEPSPAYWQAPAMLAAGFLRSTVPDMLRYMEIYRTGGMAGNVRILTKASVDAMTKPYIQCGPGQYYGYGLMITPNYHGVTLVEHGGAIKGCAAQVICVPEKGLTGVAFSNLGGVPSMKIVLGGINAYLGLALDTPRVAFPEYTCPADLLESYAGEYRSGEGAQFKIAVVDGQLEADMEGKKFATRPAGEHTFLVQIPDREMPIVFEHDATGKVYRVAMGFRIISKVSA
jgi:CubicO group peptidase (beta-lactamase class C family)